MKNLELVERHGSHCLRLHGRKACVLLRGSMCFFALFGRHGVFSPLTHWVQLCLRNAFLNGERLNEVDTEDESQRQRLKFVEHFTQLRKGFMSRQGLLFVPAFFSFFLFFFF